MEFYVYILRTEKDTLYTGWTNNLENRIRTHLRGKGSKYIRSFRDCRLVHIETFASKSEAMKREAEIKKLPKWKKEALVLGG